MCLWSWRMTPKFVEIGAQQNILFQFFFNGKNKYTNKWKGEIFYKSTKNYISWVHEVLKLHRHRNSSTIKQEKKLKQHQKTI